MSEKWTKEEIRLLLSIYKKHVNLYDVNHKNYFNRSLRINSIEEITEEMKQAKPTTNDFEVKRKIRILRIQYNMEKKRIAELQKLGENMPDVDESKLEPNFWCFNDMKFFDKCHDSENNYEKTDHPLLNKNRETNLKRKKENPKPDKKKNKKKEQLMSSTQTFPNLQIPESSSSSILPNFNEQPTNLLQNSEKSTDLLTKLITLEMNKIQDEEIYEDLQYSILMSVREAIKKDRAIQKLKNNFSMSQYMENSHTVIENNQDYIDESLQTISSDEDNESLIEIKETKYLITENPPQNGNIDNQI